MYTYLFRIVFAIFVSLSAVSAFQLTPAKALATRHRIPPITSPIDKTRTSSSNTSLNLKVKVDPNKKEDRLNPAVFRNAAYIGSIAVAVLLPVVFLVLR